MRTISRRIRDEILLVVAAWLAIVAVITLGVTVAVVCCQPLQALTP
jgi:hypothetical protein